MHAHTYRHEAMATYFEIVVADQVGSYAQQAAAAAFRELDRLESELSRFVASSDIARANRLARGETLLIGEDAAQCLLVAIDVSLATVRAFDPAYASERASDEPADIPPFTLDLATHRLTSRAQRLHLDLGAVGKGYALDAMADVLREWEIGAACLNTGGSTVLALEAPPAEPGWPVGLGEGSAYRTFPLVNAALSGSGIAVKGAHLVDPRLGRPASRTRRVWSLAPVAAQADALSTAFFVMTDAETAAFCATHETVGAAFTTRSGELSVHGALRACLATAR
ncbi:MAG TPA: FAD:protein FMN transferase [Opitutaceae bacterium]